MQLTVDKNMKDLEKIEKKFHNLIKAIIKEYGISVPDALPKLSGMAGSEADPVWFPVDGMYGGFSYYLKEEERKIKLYISSWSRIVEGSGQEHIITDDKTTLLRRGFV